MTCYSLMGLSLISQLFECGMLSFYVKHRNIYVFVDVLKKIEQTAYYVSMNSVLQ